MIAISAARWAVGKALGPVSDGLLESWAACSELGPNIRALKLELLYAQGMLTNARGRDVHNPALGQLLLELRQKAYDADDVLDELEYFRVQDELRGTYETTDADAQGLIGGLVLNVRHTAGAVVSKLKLPSCSCAPSVCQHHRKQKPKFNRVAMSKRLVEIVDELKPLCAKVSTILDLELLGTIASTGTKALQGIAFTQSTRTTTPKIIEPKLYGRDKVKMDVIDGITSKYQANNLTVLSIVGPGGLGKTTLTQHIYEEAKSLFQVLVWVCVSQNFSASRLAQEIVKQIPKLDNENGNESVEDLIEKRLQSKRFFLVLDDMWTDHQDEWKKLLAPFKKVQTKGNMAIVTTRIPKVAQKVTTIDSPIRLEHLNDEECMSLFEACVFCDQQPWEGHSNLHGVGWEIVKKLKGFPLAVKTVGRLLKSELTIEHWRRVFESKEWEYQANDDDIMPALKLSYNYLPFHLQQCFSHCALFPEDYEFGREEIIHLWIGLGLLGLDDQNKRIEDIGLGYLSNLVNHGFFHEEKKDDGHTYYVIHDLLHDLARNVSAHECISIQGSNVWSIQIPVSMHHMSIIINNSDVQDKTTFENCKRGLETLGERLKAGNLRTLMLFGDHHGSFCKLFGDMFREAKALRVIFLSGASYDVEVLLPSFSQLVHLRYLRIRGYLLNETRLVGSISRFYNLLVLDVKQCNNFGRTREMNKLVKIRYLLLEDDSYHSEIFEVGKLKSIQELRRFEVKREKHGFELSQLRQLLQLQGSLEIHNLEKVEAIIEVEETKLVNMNHLNRLLLHWGENQLNRDPKKEQDVLECLKPHSNLQEVCIRGHGGYTYPTWLCTEYSVNNLECLCLKDVAWKSFPPLLGELLMVGEERPCVAGQIFQNLKRLELVNIVTLKKWSTDSPFSKLEVLTVKDCFELTELPFPHMFPILEQIYISNCEELVSVPPIPCSSSLSKAELQRVGKSIQNLDYRKKEQRISVTFKQDALDCELWNVLAFTNLSEIKEFTIRECPPVPLHHLQLLNSLKTLVISDCSSILWSTEGENDPQFMFQVELLKISDCGATVKELAQLISYFPNLSTLVLFRCGNNQAGGAEEIEAAAGGQLPLPLQLKELLQNQNSLISLAIRDCPMLLSSSSLPSFCCPFPTSQQYLQLNGVKDGMLTLAPLTNLTKLVLNDCGGLGSEDLWHLLAQGHLKELEIQGAYNLLEIQGAHNLLDVPEPSRMCGQHHPQHSSRLRTLEAEGEAVGTVAVPIGGYFSSSLTELELYANDDMEHFTKEQSDALPMLTSLQVLQIEWYSRLKSLPEGLSRLPNLKRLIIWFCASLPSLPKGGLPSSLVELYITGCDAIRSLPKGTLPNSLTELQIHNCRAFQSLPKGSLPSSLKILSIRGCPAIRSLHQGSLPRSLQMLDVTNSNKKLQRQCRKLQGSIPIVKFRD